ncbi:hypothetical protein OG345_00025 [Streptomyces sp. NBC_01220]|uniref:hypothetical protein n=1 Tax=Streptomyces sp. NBC_01220 TaxID=2903781 RepID=UPI00352CFC84|nr:hypothetical protein OG345_00025 [Streptomyces sp. NBC_01220]
MTADLHALYPRDTEDQTVLRPLTRNRMLPLTRGPVWPPERSPPGFTRCAAQSAWAPAPARTLSRVSGALRSGPRLSRTDRRVGRAQEQGTDVAALEQTRATIEAAAKMVAKLQDGVRERAAALHPAPQPAPVTPRHRTPSSPAFNRWWAGHPLEESHEHTGGEPGDPGSRGRPRPSPRSPQGDGRRARRGPGARARRGPGWQPVWKRPRKRKSKAAEKLELHKQRRLLQGAGKRRLAAAQSRWPRSPQSRIGNAAARRDARAPSRVRHSSAWLW